MNLQRDLSLHNQLISDMFEWPQTPEQWEQYRLTDEQVEFFKKNGYLAGIKILEQEHIDRLENELSEIMDPQHPKHDLLYEYHNNESADPDKVIFHSLGHWRLTPGFHDILWNPAFAMAAHQLLDNKPVRFWHDQLFLKPPKHGGVVAWHQDYSYWTRTVPMQHLTLWVGLDDASRENGCLQYIPGSHKWGLLEKPHLTGEMEGLVAFLDDSQKEELKNPVAVEMKKGYGSFHHPLMVHGSFANDSDRPRRAFVLNVFADGTTSNHEGQLLSGTPQVRKGEKLQGQFFPVLFQ